ncbi:hypothetical protein BJV78DRAFT_563539 [Lactifluus subvellereus]|nr:hypothetical protein BJV78DRAFT_563539 [Lactifluus subvellereus]
MPKPNSRLCQRILSLSARIHASCATTRATRCLRRRCNPVCPNARVILVFRVDGASPPTSATTSSPSCSSSSIPASTNATPSSSRRAHMGSGTELRRVCAPGQLLGRGARQQSCEERILSLAAAPPGLTTLHRLALGGRLRGRLGWHRDRSRLEQQRVGRPRTQRRFLCRGSRRRMEHTGVHDAFVAGMIYTLSRRLLPSAPYTPGLAGMVEAQQSEGGQWRLDGCLRCMCVKGCSSLNGSLMDTCGIPCSRWNLLGARHVSARGMRWTRRWLEQGGLTRRQRVCRHKKSAFSCIHGFA